MLPPLLVSLLLSAPTAPNGAAHAFPAAEGARVDPLLAERFARLALACVHQEYPNKIAHVLAADGDARPPRQLTKPIRVGEHSQTAFAFGLVLDWARTREDEELPALVATRSRDYYAADRDCPLAYEPSGEDFLSPCLAEADLMRRVLGPAEYAAWLGAFLPGLPRDGRGDWLAPGIVTDPTDPKLAHLDGLNLSRAWMLAGMAEGLPRGDHRIPSLRAAADRHRELGLRAVTGEHYEGGHWLGTFAVYLVTHRGLPQAPLLSRP